MFVVSAASPIGYRDRSSFLDSLRICDAFEIQYANSSVSHILNDHNDLQTPYLFKIIILVTTVLTVAWFWISLRWLLPSRYLSCSFCSNVVCIRIHFFWNAT